MLTSFNNQKTTNEHSQSLSFTAGYAILPSLSEKELEGLRTIIRKKYINTLENFHIFDFQMMNLNNHLTIIIYLFKIIRKFGKTTKNFF